MFGTHFTTSTGQCAYVTVSEATLPKRSLLNPDLPRVPITMRSTLASSEKLTITPDTFTSSVLSLSEN